MDTFARRNLVVLAAVGFLTMPLGAAAPSFWQVATQHDLLKGEVQDLSIDSDGRLLLGPSTKLTYDTTSPFLWSIVRDRSGALYVGSGNEGKVYRIEKNGKGSVLFDSSELEVHALALDAQDTLYVGTSPDGKIYKVGRDGKGEAFFDPEDKYIWSLAFDRAGNLYAGTGEKGVIYKIDKNGKGSPFYRTKSSHVICLALDAQGNLLAGTESDGKVFRISSDGKAFVLLDSPYKEIHALRLDSRGTIYAAAIGGKEALKERRPERREEPPKNLPVPSVSTEITSISIVDVSVPSAPGPSVTPRPEDARTLKGAVYRITSDGTWEMIWSSREDSPYDVAFDTSGAVLVGTGNKGKIFRLSGEPAKPTLLTRAPAQQVTAFLRGAIGENSFATANPGKVFDLSSSRAPKGTYESEVRDAQTVASWGVISWRGTSGRGREVGIQTRSGNTETPDDTWSEWSPSYKDPEGSHITSPKARFLQWRATLTGDGEGGPVLTSVTTAYLQRNLRPEITSITVHPPGVVFQKPFSTGELEIAGYETPDETQRLSSVTGTPVPSTGAPALGRRIYQKGLQTFVWKAEDPNSDSLLYDIFYRREGETTWKLLKKGVDEPIVVWDTTSVPNGTYVIKVVASDSPSNPPGAALTGELESVPFDVDNTPPTVQVTGVRTEGGKTIVAFTVRDDNSVIKRVEYSLDAERWKVIYPKDGIADSKSEDFELVLDGDAANRSLIVRATDMMNNVATGRGDAVRQPVKPSANRQP